jgi:tetratricopeptide (TPR) repeat protein
MPGKSTWLVISMVALSLAIPSSYAADPGEQARLEQAVADAAARFVDFCRSPEVWRYDNLRPTIMRAVAPIGTIFNPPQVPVVFLSPGRPEYRRIVGEMMYRFSLYASRKQRLAEFLAEEKVASAQPDGALPAQSSPADEYLGEETHRVENKLDKARASYGGACAWAWPYFNLRPSCHVPGFEAATILNPFVPVPTIRLSEASPDYKVIVVARDRWEPRIPNAKTRLTDLHDDQKAARAATAAGANGKPFDEKVALEDCRLAKMSKIYQEMKPALRQWRTDQSEVETLDDLGYSAIGTLVVLQAQAQNLQSQIYAAEHNNNGQWIGPANELRCQLAALAPQINMVQSELARIESKVEQLRQEQASLAAQTDASTWAWFPLCDVLGRLSPVAHHNAMPLFDRWIAEEPRLWQLYLARGAAHLRLAQPDLAFKDLQRVERKLRLYDTRPKPALEPLNFVMALEAYALCQKNDGSCGDRLFAEAKNADVQYWPIYLVRGWSYLEREKYLAAHEDFKMALQLSKNTQAKPHEAMALLLAACPAHRFRDGPKAVEHATKACELTEERDWTCLDTLGAAHAEAGHFDAALESANKALKLAPAESQELIRERIAFYRDKKPYRLK